MSRAEVRCAIAGRCERLPRGHGDEQESDAFPDSGFRIDYESEPPRVAFIELHTVPGVRVLYRSVSVFETPAEELVAHVAREAPFDPHDWEFGHSYTFPP